MKKRILIGIAIAIITVIIGVIGWVLNGFFGNPVSRWLAADTAKNHLEAQYPHTDFQLDDVTFDFKSTCYHAHISSPSNIDGHFSLTINMSGKLLYDNYEQRVTHKQNTADRIDADYRKAVDTVLKSASFPYQTDIGFGEIPFVSESNKTNPSAPSYALVTEALTLNAHYDIHDIGAKAGKLTIYLADDTVSVERMAVCLLEIRAAFDREQVSFYAIDCVLEHPKTADGKQENERVEVMDFLYHDITTDTLVERVTAADQAASAYHAEKDKETPIS